MSDERAPRSVTAARPAAASERSVTLDVSILGREFKVACGEGERNELLEAVAFLDRRMREIRDAGKVSGTDRIAVMAALNIAHELLRDRRAAAAAAQVRASSAGAIDAEDARRKIQSMQAAIDEMLAGQEKLF
jgi:cell division protein ZapA